jgi:hypothetical protein
MTLLHSVGIEGIASDRKLEIVEVNVPSSNDRTIRQTKDIMVKIDRSFVGSPLLMYRLAFLISSAPMIEPFEGIARTEKMCKKRRITQLIPGDNPGEWHHSERSEPCVNVWEGDGNEYRTMLWDQRVLNRPSSWHSHLTSESVPRSEAFFCVTNL